MTIGRFAHRTGLSIMRFGTTTTSACWPRPRSIRCPATVATDATRSVSPDFIRELRWIDLPLEEIRQIVDSIERVGNALVVHRQRLEHQRGLLTAQIGDVDRFLTKGITMPAPLSSCRPVQIKIAIDDAPASITF